MLTNREASICLPISARTFRHIKNTVPTPQLVLTRCSWLQAQHFFFKQHKWGKTERYTCMLESEARAMLYDALALLRCPPAFLVHPPRHTNTRTNRRTAHSPTRASKQYFFCYQNIVNVNTTWSKKTLLSKIQALHLRIMYTFRPEINLVWDNKHNFLHSGRVPRQLAVGP